MPAIRTPFARFWKAGRSLQGRRRTRSRAGMSAVAAERLEQRALLAVSAAYYDDFTSQPPAGGSGKWDNGNQGHGVLVVTIDSTDGVDDVYMRVVNGAYQISRTTSFNASDLVTISAPAYRAPTVSPVAGQPGAAALTIGTSLPATFTRQYTLQETNPTDASGSVTPGTVASNKSTFSTILVRTSGLTDGVDTPTFTLIGASQAVTKSLVIDLNDDNGDPLSGSAISVGAPVAITENGLVIGPANAAGVATVAGYANPSGPAMPGPSPSGAFPGGTLPEGSVLLRAESISVSASGISVGNGQPIYMVSQLGGQSGLNAGGISIDGRISTSGTFTAEVIGTGLEVNAGAQIGNGDAGLAAGVVLDVTDADVSIAGKVLATEQTYFLQASQRGPDAVTRTISTRSSSTGVQTGLITADRLIAYLANEKGDPSAPGADGVLDLQTSVNTLRVTSASSSSGLPLANQVTVRNDKTLLLDALSSSADDISLATTTGTIKLQAAITTAGSLSLESGDNLVVDSVITASQDISLASVNGAVTTTAAIKTLSGSTQEGIVSITAKNDVKIDALVYSGSGGSAVTSSTGKIYSSLNLTAEPTSRLTGSSTRLLAAQSITLGTDVAFVDATVTGTGDISIDDGGPEGANQALTINSATTANGNVTFKSSRSVEVREITAGGSGNVAITTTGGNIGLNGAVVADGNGVTLTAAKFAPNGTVLHAGFITGTAPFADEISWTAANVVDDADRQAITASSYTGANQVFTTAATVLSGERFYFAGPAAAVPTGFELGTAYYVVNPTSGPVRTFQLALAPDGPAVGGSVSLAGPIVLEPGNTDLYRNIPTVSAYRLSAGGVNFTADGTTTLQSIKTTDGDIGVTSAGGSVVATSVSAKAGTTFAGNVTLEARGGDVTLGSVATSSADAAVAVLASQGIFDDGSQTTTGITANVIRLSAATGGSSSDIGSPTGRVTVASVSSGVPVAVTVGAAPAQEYPDAIDASSVYLGSSSSLRLEAQAVSLVDVRATGAATHITVQKVDVTDENGQATIVAGGNLTAGSVRVAGGAFGDSSSISLEAGGRLRNANGLGANTTLDANALTLRASTFDGTFDASNLDTFTRLSAAATAAGGNVNLAFDRAKTIVLDGITTKSGNISLVNNAVAAGGDDASFVVAAGGITAGSARSPNTVTLTTEGRSISGPTDAVTAAGTISAGSTVALTAADTVTAVTSAGQLVGKAGSSISITQTGDVRIGGGGLFARTGGSGAVTLAVTGAILPSSGKITTSVATVSATTGMSLNTDVDALSATAAAGDVTVVEDNGLRVGATGITAATGSVSLTVKKGTLTGTLTGGLPIKGAAVGVVLLEPNQSIDIDTSAATLSASTKSGGSITIRNDRSFAVGTAGIVVGNPASDDVSLTVTNGAINGGTGLIRADAVALAATTGIRANTSANSLIASSRTGDVVLTQTGRSTTLSAVAAANGSVTVNSDDSINVTSVRAVGMGKNVVLTAGGVNKKIAFGAGSIAADGDAVSLTATGGLDGTSAGKVADITASSIVLSSSGGDVTATVAAATIKANAAGTDTDTGKASNLDLTVLGSKPLFVGTATGVTLGAAGNVTLRTKADPATPPSFGLPLIVVGSPTAGGTVTYETDNAVTFVVTATTATGAGSLAKALADAGTATVTGGGTTGVGFATTITSPIQLVETLSIGSKITLDGTQRINTATGALSTGRPIDIDGSGLVTGTAGFKLSGASDNSTIRGFAFYGFNKAGGAGVSLAANADNVTISNNLFGISSTGRVSSNANGIIATGVNAPTIIGNTVVKSTDTGIKLDTVKNAVVTRNLVGTDTARTSLGNATGIQVTGVGGGNTIGGTAAGAGNVVSFNTTAGIHLSGADASNATATVVRGNEVLLNATGMLVNGATKNATIAGNTVTRNTADGIVVNGTSQDVTVGGSAAADRNYVGTNAGSSLGLGNARNGIVVSSTGSGIVVRGNTVLGNGTANVAGDNAGVKLTGASANGVTIQGNVINANRGAGVLAGRTGTGVVTITRNTISSNSGSGVQVTSGPVVVGSSASETTDATIRGNANTINSNAAYGVNVAAGAFAQIAGNSMASNPLGGISNPNLTPAPTITSVTRSAATGTLTVNLGGLTAGQVVHVYTGTGQGRTYLGRFTATGATGTFTMTFAAQQAAGVASSVFAGAPITATRTSTGAGTQNTSAFAAVRAVTRVA